MIVGPDEDGKFDLITFFDQIKVKAEVPRARMEKALDVLGAMLTQSNITQRHVDKEREEINAERIDNNLNFYSLEDINGPYVAHSKSLLLFPVVGSEDGIRATSAETLKRFHAETVRAGRVVIGVSGDIDKDRVAKLVEKYFPLPSGERARTEKPEYTGGDERYPVVGLGEGVRIAPAVKTPVASEFRQAAIYQVANKLLMQSKGPHSVYRALRNDRGVIYKLRLGCIQSEDSGLISIAYNIAPKNVAKSLRAIKKVLTGMATQVDEKAFALVRAQEQKEFDRIMNLKGVGATVLVEDTFAHGLNKPPTYASNLRLSVEKEEVQEAARRMLANPTFLAMGETQNITSPEEARTILFELVPERRVLPFRRPDTRLAQTA